jgi:transposase
MTHHQSKVPPSADPDWPKEEVALFRLGVIADLVDRRLEQGEKERLLREKTAHRWDRVDSRSKSIGRSTILKWIRRYRNSGKQLESLYPRERRDKGKTRSLDENLLSILLTLKRDHPEATARQIVEQTKQAGVAPEEIRISFAHLYRLFKRDRFGRSNPEVAREEPIIERHQKHALPVDPPPPPDRHEWKKEVALFRLGVIADLVDRRLERGEKERILKDKVSSSWLIVGSRRESISRSSILAWLSAYKESGKQLESLYPRERRDKGKTRSLDENLLSILLAFRRGHPEIAVGQLIEEAKQMGVVPEELRLSPATLYRLFKRDGTVGPDTEAARKTWADGYRTGSGQANASPSLTMGFGYEPGEEVRPTNHGRMENEKKRREDNLWMTKLLQGAIELDELRDALGGRMAPDDVGRLYRCVMTKPLRYRNRAVSILSLVKGISPTSISDWLFIPLSSVRAYLRTYQSRGVGPMLSDKEKRHHKHEDPRYTDMVFSILHSPPSLFGLNRTSWTQDDLWNTLKASGMALSQNYLRKIIYKAGFKYRKARIVLTSNDPQYREKIEAIKNVLAHLGPKEKFFSIDEYGPFAVKLQGGTSLVPQGTIKTIPQWQKSKGSLIITAALELSTNQITHFYSKEKNTAEMIKLLDILVDEYADEECIYFSWDAASWHASKELYKKVEMINSDEYRSQKTSPFVKLAPLPTCAQFLNVIESVFSGLARAIIHNSDYQSVDECKAAIDRYFPERNAHFRKHPKRAGNRIWGKERVEATFKESNNCKDPMYCR